MTWSGNQKMRINKRNEKKEHTGLDFYIWRIKYLPSNEWREEILLHGSDMALNTLVESLQGLIETSKVDKKGTRKFRCNPPPDFNVPNYASNNRAKIVWIDWLIIKIDPSKTNESQYTLQDREVTIFYNIHTLSQFIESVNQQLHPKTQYLHGSTAPGGFYFSPDWLGAE
jgi:hypothetical protein